MAASKTERVLTFYRGLLNSLDLVVDEDGRIAFAPPGAVDKKGNPVFQDALVDGKRWCLPTQDILDQAKWEENIAFHPFSENFANEESETLTKLKAAINLKLGTTVGKLMVYLTEFAADAERHGKVSAKASKFLRLVPNLKAISSERIEEIFERSTLHADRRFVNVYMKKGGSLDGMTYGYAAMVTFPFRKELDGAEPKVFGVTISKKDQASFKTLFDFILPGNDELSTYSAGSSSNTAPRLEALLKAYVKLANVLNELVTVHKKVLPTYDELLINTDWAAELSQFAALADVIPPLPGNIGAAIKDRRTDQGVQMKPAANRLFGRSEPKERRPEPQRASVGYQPTAMGHPQGQPVAQAPAAPLAASPAPEAAKEDTSKLSFAERQARAREREREMQQQFRQQAQPAVGGYQAYQPGQAGVPDWMASGSTAFRVAGDVPQQPMQHYQPGSAPQSSFAERMARRNAVGGYGQGGYQSTSRFVL